MPNSMPITMPVTEATKTMPIVMMIVFLTSWLMALPCCMLIITCMIEIITSGTTIILIRLI